MPVLELRSLRKSFFTGSPRSPRRVDALLDVDLDVDGGEILGVVGNQFAGKTTLLLCAAGLLRRDGGTIRWFGENFAGGGCLPGVVYIPSVPTYYPFLTVRDVLQYYCMHDGTTGIGRARLIADTAAQLALTNYLTTSVGKLPVEMLIRLGVAQALVDEPKVIMLDGSLDVLNGAQAIVCRVLRNCTARGMTVIATSRHAGSLAAIAARIVVMDAGRLTGSFAAMATSFPSSVFPPLPGAMRHIAERVH
jgi:ABC-2 type transport system ATP-binding protein